MNNFKDKKVAVLGLGIENRALLNFLIKKGAEVTVCDQNKRLAISDKRLGVSEWRLGPDYLKNLTDFEIIFRTPGLPRFMPELVEAELKGVEISSATKLFFDLCPAKIIGITGTKGKGTCATLIYEILKKSQISNLKSQIYLAGNIGNPAISLMDKLKTTDWVILELSSFQLQDLDRSPHIAIILNIESDHLDYHKTKTEYVKAKENLVKYQNKNDFAVINMDYFTSYKFATLTKGKVYWFSRRKSVPRGCFVRWKDIEGVRGVGGVRGIRGERFGRFGEIILQTGEKEHLICPTYEIDLIGLHNLENILAASLASYLTGASVFNIEKVITTFKGLEHRLEFVKDLDGVRFYNDSFSTTPETTIAAIKSFEEPIILICGGRSKGGDYDKLAEAVKKSSVKSLILIGEMADEINEKIKNKKEKLQFKIQNLGVTSMKEIVKIAKKEAEEGDIVLLSPACASFDMFKNASQRGREFKKTVKFLANN